MQERDDPNVDNCNPNVDNCDPNVDNCDLNVDNCDPNQQQSDEVHSDNTIVARDVADDTLTWKWEAAKYSVDRNTMRFIVHIIKSVVNYITVKYLKSTAFDKYVWPEIDNIDVVHKSLR